MPKAIRWKVALVLFLFVLAIILVLPSFTNNLPGWYKKVIYSQGLRLGLDLQGGMNLILKVDVDQAVINALNNSARDLKEALKHRHISVVELPSPKKGEVVFSLPNKQALAEVKNLLSSEFHDLEIVSINDQGNFPKITLRLSPKEEKFIRDNAVEQSLEIIRNRIDQFGVTEPVIVRRGKDEIVVQLPGIKNPKRAIKLIGETAQLEFKLVDDSANINLNHLIEQAIEDGRLSPSQEFNRKAVNKALKGEIPPGDSVYFMVMTDPQTGRRYKVPILLKNKTLMTGDAIKTAHVRIGGPYNQPYVSLTLTDRGARIFEQITGANVGKRLAIVLDGVVRSAPVIREKIAGGHAQITGSFTHEEATDLAIVLRAGALPAPVKIIQNVTVGPSLGRDSIEKGIFSGLVGAAIVLIFMIVYYRLSGFIADIALLLNILFLMAVLSAFHATLTLPGIAGIILTIGMGVDSNVLIFERMREEKALGKSLHAYIDGGYDKAFWTIVDAHVTTLITALALFLFGTGPIKGFAVTLSAGIIINLFTAIFASRIVYDWLLAKKAIKDLSFLHVVENTNIDFIGKRYIAFGLSAILVTLGIIGFIQINRGKANLGVDFTGGTMAQYKADKPFNLEAVRRVMGKAGIKGYTLQDVPKEHILIVKIKKSVATVQNVDVKITKALNTGIPGVHFVLQSKSEIGAAVSKDLRQKAIIAIAISMAGIIIYLAFRFNLSFGVAAAIATFHDVLAVLGIFFILNKEINLLIVTALLTLAGYSLTDTVVIFDRIRENLRRHRKMPFDKIINLSVNEMLARTIITSLTTLMVIVCLFLFGGVVIHDFAFALMIGVIVGTYSSVFVASPIVYLWHKGQRPKQI